MKLNFVKVSPAQNMTIFILDQVPRSRYMTISRKLMDYSNIYAEQVGFIERVSKEGGIRLQMMGGEFCGNATRSLAALMVHNELPNIEKNNDDYIVSLEVSGIEGVLKCEVRKTDIQNIYSSKSNMPKPISIEEFHIINKSVTYKTIRVDFPGISHFIVDDDLVDDRNCLYNLIKEEMDKSEYEAFGIMYYDYEREFMTPLVYVRGTDSLLWEKSCGSGTSALGVALAYKTDNSINRIIKQPGGELEVSVEWREGNVSKLSLAGLVEIVAEGIVYIS